MTTLKYQRGVILIVCLVLLLLLTLITISSVQNTTLEEKIAGNLFQQNLAFQAAEAALRQGEADTETIAPTDYYVATLPIKTDQIDWTNNKVRTYSFKASNNQIFSTQYLIIQIALPKVSCKLPCIPGSGPFWYYVFSRVSGGTLDSQVILRSTYTRSSP